jgi:hypothetical protein
MQNYYTPNGRRSDRAQLQVKDDYNWNVYNATNVGANPDTYWDSTFVCRVDTASPGSNVSYSSMPIVGERQLKQWRDSLDSKWAIVGNRGVRDGDLGQQYKDSITLLIHGGTRLGNICYNDNHVAPTDLLSRRRQLLAGGRLHRGQHLPQ